MFDNLFTRINQDNESDLLKRRAERIGRAAAFRQALGEYSNTEAAMQDLIQRNGRCYLKEACTAADREKASYRRRAQNCHKS